MLCSKGYGMYVGLTRFVTDAFVILLQNILQGYTSEFGYPLNVSVRRAYNYDPIVVPEVWVESDMPSEIRQTFIGATIGDIETTYSFLADDFRCPFGIQTKLPVERDDLFDYITQALMIGVDPVTKNSWLAELFNTSGIQIKGIINTQYMLTSTTRYGEIFEGRGEILCATLPQTNLTFANVTAVPITMEPSLFTLTLEN